VVLGVVLNRQQARRGKEEGKRSETTATKRVPHPQ
jgi:hypothetical protein